MSRAATGDLVHVPPSNNVYTVLVAVATLVQIIGIVLIFMRFTAVFGPGSNIMSQ